MRLKSFLIISVSVLFTLNSYVCQAYDRLEFSVPNFPPYAYLEEQKLVGVGVERVKKALDKMGVSYNFTLVSNHGVALEKLRSHHTDGFFLATQNSRRDRYAVMSGEVLKNDWAWFYLPGHSLTPDSPNFKQDARVGTRMNTNTFVWLKDQGYNVASVPNEAGTLVKMLLKKRLDSVFLASNVFWYAVQNQRIEQQEILQKTQSSNPFGVYFSKRYLSHNPTFLADFNRTLAELD